MAVSRIHPGETAACKVRGCRREHRYRVRYDLPGSTKANRRQSQEMFDVREDAERFDLEQRRLKQLGGRLPLKTGAQTLSSYALETWMPTHGAALAKRTREVHAWVFRNYVAPDEIGALSLTTINPDILLGWQNRIGREMGYDGVLKARHFVGGVLKAAANAQLIAGNPMSAVRMPPRPAKDPPVAWSPATIEAIRSKLDKHRDRTLVSLMAYAGLRPQEACALLWSDVGERSLRIGAQKTVRHNPRPRHPRLLAPLAADLKAWRLACGRPDPGTPVLLNADGAAMSARVFNAWRGSTWKDALEAAKVEYQRPYVLRHSFASLLLYEGRSTWYVSEQLGNSAKVCDDTYGHLVKDLEYGAGRVDAEEAIRAAREGIAAKLAATR